MNIDNIFWSDFKVYSFDVFDTVVTRRTATPAGIFKIVEKLLSGNASQLPERLVNNFAEIRLLAEVEARRISSNEEVTLTEIYRMIAKNFNLSPEVRDSLSSLEVDQEFQQIRPVPQVIHLLNSLYEQKKRIIFTSDTYLPKDVIKNILINTGAYKESAGLYVSSEALLTKGSGKLFKKVILLEGCSPREILHIGDNFHSDNIQARRVGIKTIYFRDTQLNRYENILLRGSNKSSAANDHGYVWEIISGASRLARLNSCGSATRYRTLSSLAGNVACPILFIYVIWLLREAKINNINRIYFFSRDGQILLKMAEHVKNALHIDIDLRYLYISRQAVSLAALSEIDERECLWLFRRDPWLTINIFSKRAGLDPIIVQKELQTAVGRTISEDKDLDAEEECILDRLIKSPALASSIIDSANIRKSDALKYYTANGIFDKISWAVADLGWQGSIQLALRKILDSSGHAETAIFGLYFGMKPSCRTSCSVTDHRKALFCDEDSPCGKFYNEENLVHVLEIFTAADHGTVKSYSAVGEANAYPVLEPLDRYSLDDFGLSHLRAGYDQFMSEIDEDLLNGIQLGASFFGEYKTRACQLLKCLNTDPSKEEAEALGDYLSSRDQTECIMRRYAPPFSIIDSVKYLYLRPALRSAMTFWIAGTRARSNFMARILLSEKMIARVQGIRSGLGSILRFIKHILKNK